MKGPQVWELDRSISAVNASSVTYLSLTLDLILNVSETQGVFAVVSLWEWGWRHLTHKAVVIRQETKYP